MRPLHCERCHEEADVDWVITTTFQDAKPTYMPGAMRCRTEGCVGLDGSNATQPIPSPAEMRARADRSWLDQQIQLTREAS